MLETRARIVSLSLCYSILSTNYPVSAFNRRLAEKVLLVGGEGKEGDRLLHEESEMKRR